MPVLIELWFSIPWSLLLRCLSLRFRFLLLLLTWLLANRLSSWFNLWLHLEWLVATFLLSVCSFLLHQGLHSSILVLEQNFLLVQIWHLVFLLCSWPKILGNRLLFCLFLSFCIDFTVLLLNFLNHLLLRFFIEIRSQHEINLFEVIGEFVS